MEIKINGLGVSFVSLLIILQNCALGRPDGNDTHRHHHTVRGSNQNEVKV